MQEGLDLDLSLLLERAVSRSAAGGGGGGPPPGDAGDRILAGGGRYTGAAADGALAALRAAAAAGGWDASRGAGAVLVEPEHAEGPPGREVSLLGSIADACVYFYGVAPEAMRSGWYPPPAAALAFGDIRNRGRGGGIGGTNLLGTVATVRYLASGPNADAGLELTGALRRGGFDVAGLEA
jgi:hypothetical protein